MRRSAFFLAVIVSACLFHSVRASTVRLVDIDDKSITPVTSIIVERAIKDAEAAGDSIVLITLDTPGGLVSSMESIVKDILAAKVPVVVFVGPPGAKAASAGFFILISADVAAMAPGTRTGAASVVYGPGEESKDGDILLRKMTNDAAAMIRSITDRRGRNVEAAEQAVLTADAYTETVALDKGLIELIVADRDELLEKLNGMEIRRFDGTTLVLDTSDPEFVRSEFNLKDKFWEFLATPEVAYLLLLLGMGGLYIEFTHPGLVFPAVVGVLCLILFAMAYQVLPINTVAILLIILAIVMFILEVKVVSYGMLTVGGLACLLIGSFMLVDGPIPELRVPLSLYLPSCIILAAIVVFVMYKVVKAHGSRVQTGVEGLIGEVGDVTVSLAPEGKVFIHGEIWDARTGGGPVSEGQKVRVRLVDDMVLVVEPIRSEQGPSPTRPEGE